MGEKWWELSKGDNGRNGEQCICLRDTREIESTGLEVGVGGEWWVKDNT